MTWRRWREKDLEELGKGGGVFGVVVLVVVVGAIVVYLRLNHGIRVGPPFLPILALEEPPI